MLTILLMATAWAFVMFVAGVSGAEKLAATIAGFIAPILTEVLKRFFGVSGLVAFFVTVVVSFLVAVAALFASGEITGVGDIYATGMMVMGIATTVYRLVTEKRKSAEQIS